MPDPTPTETQATRSAALRIAPVRARPAASFVLVTVSLLLTLVLSTGAASAAPTAGRCRPSIAAFAGDSRVGLVVDFGTAPGSTGRVETFCVGVPAGSDGFDVLQAAGLSFRTDASGLLCGIGGFPATGCGETTPDGYRYWAYFRATAGSWQYGSIGPGSSHPAEGAVEGWRFVQGAGNPSDPPPRHAAGFASICQTAPTTPPTTSRPPAPSTTAPAAVPAPGGGAVTSTTTRAAVPQAPPPGDGATTTPSADVAGATPGSTDAGSVPADGTVGTGPASEAEEAAARSTLLVEERDDDGGSGALGVAAGAALVAGLGALAAIRFRREPDDGSM